MTSVCLKDRDGKITNVLRDVGKEFNSVGVVLYSGGYYTYHSYEIQEISKEMVIIFAITDIAIIEEKK